MSKLGYLLMCVLFISFCKEKNTAKNRGNQHKVIALQENVNIVIPVSERDFNDSLTYMHIEIWIDSQLVFKDTTLTEYLFGDKQWPQSKKIKTGEYEVLMPVFDAPDFNKIWAFYFKNGIITRKILLPFFDNYPVDFNDDGKKEYMGILSVTDAYESDDSCYYNPALYYEMTHFGVVLDSALTIEMNRKDWGVFLGFDQLNKVLPCPNQ